MANIQKLSYPYFTDGTTLLGASTLNPIIAKINELVDKANGGVTPTTVATPVIIINGNSATITCATSGATIRYTTNGGTPTSSSTQYTGAITLSGATTIKAIAIKDGVSSSVATQSYTPASVSAPIITISGNSCTITCATSGATIYYTTNGNNPTSSSTQYSGTITLQSACTVKAIAIKDGVSSSVSTASYTPAAQNITFADSHVKAKLIAEGVDTNNDGEISPAEAAAVTDSLPGTWSGNTDIVSFDEFQYFTGVTRLKSSQFDGDSNLESIVFPSDITTFGGAAFKNCIKLGTITLPSNLTSIGDGAFSGCTLFNTSSIPSGVTEIGSTVFTNCSALSLSSLPNGITSIGNNSFANCPNLALSSLPSSLTTIGSSTFKASGITISALPSGLTTISGSAFYGCTGITVSVIPATVTSIGNYAFRNCTGITTIEIASSGTALGENVFNGCTNLTKVKLPTTPPTLANANAFPSGANFYVPDATAKAAYLADSVWGTYGDSRFKLYSEW